MDMSVSVASVLKLAIPWAGSLAQAGSLKSRLCLQTPWQLHINWKPTGKNKQQQARARNRRNKTARPKD